MENDERDEGAALEPAEEPATASTGEGDVAAGGVVAEDVSAQAKAARLREELDRFRELYLRKLAEFDNYRKRQEREMGEFRNHANADLLRDCLPVVDNLERALESPLDGGDAVRAGVELVLRQLRDLLARYGVSEVDPVGQTFDPTLHEAVQRRETVDVEHNTVVQVVLKGYVLREKLLRPALVVVAVPASAVADGGEDPQAG